MRIKTMSIAEKRIQTSQEEAMRRIIGETVVQMGKEMTIAEIIKSVISGDMAKNVAKACRVVIPVKRIEIRKSEVTSRGNEEPESIIEAQPEEEEEPEESPAEEPAEEPEAAEAD